MNGPFSHVSSNLNLPLSDSPTHVLSPSPHTFAAGGPETRTAADGREGLCVKEIVKETKTIKIKSLNQIPVMAPPSHIPLFPLTKCDEKIKQNRSNKTIQTKKNSKILSSLPLTFRVECVVECPRAHRVGHAQDNEGTTPLRGMCVIFNFLFFYNILILTHINNEKERKRKRENEEKTKCVLFLPLI